MHAAVTKSLLFGQFDISNTLSMPLSSCISQVRLNFKMGITGSSTPLGRGARTRVDPKRNTQGQATHRDTQGGRGGKLTPA